MAMPRKLKNMNLFNEGNSHVGVAKTVTLPKLGRKMEGFRGAGMNGTAKADMGLSDDGLQLEHTYGGLDLISIRQFGISKADGVGLRFVGAYQRDDTGEVDAVEIVVRGRHEEIDMGNAEPGADTEHKVVTPLTYYKLTVNGTVEVEIDLLNFVETIDGVDRLAEQRNALGI
jgi:P2 family phage contractile tail tube protein